MIVKKTFIISPINSRYALQGKKLGGLLKITSAGNSASAQLCLTNIDPARMGQWKVCLRVDGTTTVKDMTDLCDFSFAIPVVEGDCEVDLLVCLVDGNVNPVAYATNKSFNAWNENLLQWFEERDKQGQQPFDYEREKFPEPAKQTEQEIRHFYNEELLCAEAKPHTKVSDDISCKTENAEHNTVVGREEEREQFLKNNSTENKNIVESELTDYEKFVAAADNYYEREKQVVSPIDLSELKARTQRKFTAVEEFSNAFEAYAQNPQGNYYIKVKRQLEQIFSQYPPYPALIEKVADSYWVKIDYEKGSYFAVGLILERMLPRFLAYAVPSRQLLQVSDNSFSLLGDRQNGYYVLYQDADSGECVIGKP